MAMSNDSSVEIRFGASTNDVLDGISQIRSALAGLGSEIKILQQGLAEKKILLNAEVSQFQITQNQKFALLEAETQKEYETELALLGQKLSMDSLTEDNRKRLLDRIALVEAKHRTEKLRLDEESI